MNDIWPNTHNLKILIVDNNDNIIDNPELIESIYAEFVDKNIIKKAVVIGNNYEVHLQWEKE
jgi:hypothetical protein